MNCKSFNNHEIIEDPVYTNTSRDAEVLAYYCMYE